MPQKKKRKVVGEVGANKPGVAHDYLSTTFSNAAQVSGLDLSNGHVLFLYKVSHDTNLAETEQAVLSRFPEDKRTEFPKNLVKNRIRLLVENFQKFRKLTDKKQFERFALICNEGFSLACKVHARQQQLNSEPLASTSTSPSSPTVSSAKGNKSDCLQCAVLRKRLKKAIELRREQHQNHNQAVRVLKSKLHLKPTVRVLNQKIKRKDACIKSLKLKYIRDQTGADKQKYEARIKKLKRRCITLEKKVETLSSALTEAELKALEHADELNKSTQEKDSQIAELETDLEEKVEACGINGSVTVADQFVSEGKAYSVDTRLFVYDSIVNQVPVANVPKLISQFVKHSGAVMESVLHRSTVEFMVRELGVITDLQTAEVILKNEDTTVGFGATTHEGVHVNDVHVTFKSDVQPPCLVVAIDQLPGGTAEDYCHHILDSVDHLGNVYSSFHGTDYSECREKLICNISNTMTDRAAANHVTVQLLNESWNKTLNELNCHLHPLEMVASKCRSALKSFEESKGKLWGKDCFAANIVLALNKFRFKDGTGDPMGFKLFLCQENLGKGFIPRYRGNRLHIIFHLCGKYFAYHSVFLKYLELDPKPDGFRADLTSDFKQSIAKVELQVMGLIGKLFSGPWMAKFYTSALNEIKHVEGIGIIKDVIQKLKGVCGSPLELLTIDCDFFGDRLDPVGDGVLSQLRQQPCDSDLFEKMMSSCLNAIVKVLEKQYQRYFEIDITLELEKQTESARSHNIGSEQLMGIFSAAQKKAPNATLHFLSSKIRAQKNRVMNYLDSMSAEDCEKVIKFAVTFSSKHTIQKRKDMKVVLEELRAQQKRQKQMGELKEVEKKLASVNEISDLIKLFPDSETETLEEMLALLKAKCIGRDICHFWADEDTGQKTIYCGRIEKSKGQKNFIVAYWEEQGSHADAEDFLMSRCSLAADLYLGDLELV